MGKLKQISIFFAVALSFVIAMNGAQADTGTTTSEVKAPILISPNEKTVTAKVKPLITGLVKSGYTVHFYIDGVYNGKLENLTHRSGTANFAYKPFLNLSVGSHMVMAVATDAQGNRSILSNVLNFKIEHPMPAPTMKKPVVNSKSTKAQPFIVGLAKNDSIIRVFIDKKLVAEFKVKNDKSGTANFAFKPSKPLSRGTHLIFTTAVDSRGKESSWSNLVWHKVPAPAIVLGIEEKKESATSTATSSAESNNQASSSTSLLDKIKSNGKITLNLVIFIAFLVGIVLWIIWVNRELVKEKKDAVIPDQKSQQKK